MMAHVSDFRLSSEIMQVKVVYGNTGFFCFCDILVSIVTSCMILNKCDISLSGIFLAGIVL